MIQELLDLLPRSEAASLLARACTRGSLPATAAPRGAPIARLTLVQAVFTAAAGQGLASAGGPIGPGHIGSQGPLQRRV